MNLYHRPDVGIVAYILLDSTDLGEWPLGPLTFNDAGCSLSTSTPLQLHRHPRYLLRLD